MPECPLVLVTSEVSPGIWTVEIQGPLEAANLSSLRAVIGDLFSRGIYRFILDLEKITYISSSGFSCFVASVDIARKNGGEIIFSTPSPDVRGAFHLLGLSQMLRLVRDLKSAIAAFSQPAAS